MVRKTKKLKRVNRLVNLKKKSSGILKMLEVFVMVGAFAAFLMKFLQGKKAK